MNGPPPVVPANPNAVSSGGPGIIKPEAQLPSPVSELRTSIERLHPVIHFVAQKNVVNLEGTGRLVRPHRPKRKKQQQNNNTGHQKKKKSSVPRHYTHRPGKNTSAKTKEEAFSTNFRTTSPEMCRNSSAWIFPEALYHEYHVEGKKERISVGLTSVFLSFRGAKRRGISVLPLLSSRTDVRDLGLALACHPEKRSDRVASPEGAKDLDLVLACHPERT
jgi:hypothetical protein